MDGKANWPVVERALVYLPRGRQENEIKLQMWQIFHKSSAVKPL